MTARTRERAAPLYPFPADGAPQPAPQPLDPATLRGLPAPLPDGEHALWQGSPLWTALAQRSLHGRLIGIYFGLLVLWHVGEGLSGGDPASTVAESALFAAALGLAALGLIGLYAWLAARTTVYTITNRRVLLTVGIALPVTLNLPLKGIGSADVKLFADGTGDIPLAVTGKQRLSFVVLWPHVRPWKVARVQPMLRAVPRAAEVASILGAAWSGAQPDPRHVASAPNAASPSPAGAAEHAPEPAGLRPVAA